MNSGTKLLVGSLFALAAMLATSTSAHADGLAPQAALASHATSHTFTTPDGGETLPLTVTFYSDNDTHFYGKIKDLKTNGLGGRINIIQQRGMGMTNEGYWAGAQPGNLVDETYGADPGLGDTATSYYQIRLCDGTSASPAQSCTGWSYFYNPYYGS